MYRGNCRYRVDTGGNLLASKMHQGTGQPATAAAGALDIDQHDGPTAAYALDRVNQVGAR